MVIHNLDVFKNEIRAFILSKLQDFYFCAILVAMQKPRQNSFKIQYQSLNAVQRSAVDVLNGTVVVLAGPGTGKTQVLSMRIANLLLQPDVSPYNILCLTYSNAGTSAMKKRLLQLIGPEAYQITVSTFHAFCNQIIIENPAIFENNKILRQIQELDKIEIMDNILFQLPLSHPFKNKREEYSSNTRGRLLKLVRIIAEEGLQIDDLQQWFENYQEDIPNIEKFIYKRKYRDKLPGEINQAGNKEIEDIEKWKTAITIANQYLTAVQEAGFYDYNDMISQVINAFQQHENLLARYQERYQYVLVDEYQDTNGAQNKVLELLMGYWENPNLFVVGDDDQAIYRFQGANTYNLLQIIERFPPQAFLVLNQNYRSTQPILNAAAVTIQKLTERLINVEAIQQKYQLHKDLQSNVTPISDEKIVCYKLESAEIELFWIIRLIQQRLEKNTDPSEIAVLVRKNKHAERIFRLLENQQIPASLSKTTNLLEEKFTDNILLLLEYLLKSYHQTFLPGENNTLFFQLLLCPWWELDAFSVQQSYTIWEQNERNEDKRRKNFYDFIHTLSAEKSEDFQIKEQITKVARSIDFWVKDFQEYSFEEWLERVWYQSGIIAFSLRSPTQLTYVEQLKTFFTLLQELYTAEPNAMLVLEKIQKMRQEKISVPVTTLLGGSRGVRISTLHSAKGEEYSHVIMANCSEKYWKPYTGAEPFLPPVDYLKNNPTNKQTLNNPKANQQTKNDERRLFYVGITRAKYSLTFTYTTENQDTQLSFLSELIDVEQCIEKSIETETVQKLIQEHLPNYYNAPLLKNFETLSAQYFAKRIEEFQLSVTHLNTFFECPRKFYLAYIIKLPTSFTPDSAFGTAIHEALRSLMENYKSHKLLPTEDEFIQKFKENITTYRYLFSDPKFKTYQERGEIILKNYYNQMLPTWHNLKNWWTEQSLNAKLPIKENFIELNGKLDLILQTIENQWICVDYKTGKADKTAFKKRTQEPQQDIDYQLLSISDIAQEQTNKFGGNYWRQMVFYQILTSQHIIFNTNNVFQFHLLESQDVEEVIQPIEISTTSTDIVTKQIYFFYKSLLKFEFPQKTSDFQDKEPCSYCNFKNICWK